MSAARNLWNGRLVATLVLALLLLLCVGTAASQAAAPWGEQNHFALPTGEGSGEVNPEGSTGELQFTAGPEGTYYVADRFGSEGFRLQRFAAKTKTVQGSITFVPPQPTKASKEEGTEATSVLIAADPSRNRVYVLSVYERREATEKEEEKGQFPLDDKMAAAGSLYAFEYRSGKLESVNTEGGKPAPVLTRIQLKGQGEAPKEALLEPHGLAVDPATGNLVIVGNVDEESNTKVEEGKAEKKCRAVAQFATPTETGGQLTGMALGRREVDHAGVIQNQNGRLATGCGGEEAEQAQTPLSPVFAPGEKLLVGYFEGVGAAGQRRRPAAVGIRL